MFEYSEGGLEACVEFECRYCGDAGMLSFSLSLFFSCLLAWLGVDGGWSMWLICGFGDSSSSLNRMPPIR